MAECIITLDLGGKRPLDFKSNRELDSFLWDNKETLLHNVSNPEVFLDINKKSEMNLRVQNIRKAGISYENAVSSGMVKMVSEIGDLAIGVGLSNLYKKLGSPRNMEKPGNLFDGSILPEDQLNYRRDLGTDVHAIVEAKLGGNPNPKLKVLNKNPGLKAKVEQQVDKMLSDLIRRHTVNGIKPTFYTETRLVSKNIDPSFLDLIHNSDLASSYNVSNNPAEIRQAWGKADLIVVDDNGKVIVYDMKTTSSTIDVGSQKNLGNELNLGSYVAMMRQWEVPAVSGGFLELNVKYTADGLSATDITWNAIKPFNSGASMDAALTYFPSNVANPIEAIDDLDTIMKRIVPQGTFMNQQKLLDLDANVEKNKTVPIQDSDTIHNYRPNAKYKYFIPITRKPSNLDGRWLYGNWLIGNTKEELNSRIDEYVRLANEMDSEILPLYATAIENAIASRDMISLESELRTLSPTTYKQIYTQLKKYITNRWTLLNDASLIQNGIFIFQKPNSAQVEVVMVDTHALNMPLSFNSDPNNKNKDSNRTSILGQFLRDSAIDPMFFMRGTVGNAVLLKGMVYFNQHPEVLNGNKIVTMKAISVKDNHVINVSNLELNRTYDRLVLEYNKKYSDNKLTRRTDILMDDVQSAIIQCHGILENSAHEEVRNLMHYKAFRETHPDGVYTINELIDRLRQIQRYDPSMDSARMSADNELQMAKLALQRGFMAYYGFNLKSENDIGLYTDHQFALEGAEASSMKESKSVILRQLQMIISNFHDVYKEEFVKLSATWQNAYDKFKKEAGISPIVSDDFKYFREHWFIKDGNKIHNSMRLINDNDSYWTGKPAEKALYDLYLSFWNRLRYNNDLEDIQTAKSDGSYYEIPLIRTNFKKQLEAGGLWDAAKGWFARAKRDAAGLFFNLQEAKDVIEASQEERIETIKLPSYIQDFVGDARTKAIDKYGTAAYETNMDIVALTVLAVGLRREMSEHAMMLTTALRANSYYESIVDANTMKNILDTYDKQVNSKMFQRSVIDPENRGIAMLINYLKSITSTGTLMFSWKSFARETIRGITDAFSRIKWDEMYSEKFGYKDYMEGLKVVLESAPGNYKMNSFIMQLSHYFGMANFSGNQVVAASRSNPYGLYELDSDIMFITATWPDFIHRTAMLIAHLKHIGAWDAYYLDDNNVITYDMTKDKRFQTWLKYKDDVTKIPEGEIDTFVKERDLYRELLRDFEIAGKKKPDNTNYVEGDLLPDGLSPRTQDNLKTVADRLYGNYDDETKSLMQKRLLGSLFFQFKTYPLERLSHWFKSSTHVNDIQWELQYWDDGEPIIAYFTEDGKAIAHGKLSDIDKNWLLTGQAWYLKYPNGHQVMGHIQRCFAVLGYVLNHNQAELENTWATNPYFRGQLALGLYDTLFGVLLAFLIKVIFGEETIQNMKNEEWYTRWLYAVGTGMTQDGPVWSLIGNIVGNGAPPSLSIIRQYMTNAASVITGDMSLIYGFATSIGTTREFTSLLTDQ